MAPVTILLADTDPVVRKCLRYAVEASGQEIKVMWEAQDGFEALHKIQQFQPDLAVVDYMLPRMNGLELARCLRNHGLQTRILVMGTFEAQQQAVLDAGADGFVTKSSGCEAIKAAVHRLVMLPVPSSEVVR
ncbi:MAG TPA: response regulator transcription factor [Chthonomonas sp.]|uniref:response regulator n=1 Tax=Chthonomonas sp. TaxID=2282153 RepID=UPI002B4B648B|nr:response regulator transcription factor [Chthonomonas sp.]HLI49456.1 response regulator transcription factor [Chthonomonas sp.]